MKLPSLFTDHAVLQHGIHNAVWGTTLPNLTVTAKIADTTAKTISSVSGAFQLYLPPLPIGGPYTLVITTDDAKESATVSDILVGEVWVASGQSNMFFALCNSLPDPEPIDCPNIRLIAVPRIAPRGSLYDFEGAWTPAHVGDAQTQTFSAVGYHFARRLHAELGIPVGVIHSSWGGTRIESWTSRKSLLKHPTSAQLVHDYDASLANPDYWEVPKAELPPVDPGIADFARDWFSPDFDDSSWTPIAMPARFVDCQSPKTNGSFWFRKTLTLPTDWIGEELILSVGAVDKHDITFFNGTQVGTLGSGYEGEFWNVIRCYTVPAALNAYAKITIAVRAWSFAFDGGLRGPAEEMFIMRTGDPTQTRIPIDGEWYTHIEHDVGLTPPPPPPSNRPGIQHCPHTLFDGMIQPLLSYGMRGVIWYQGESNARRGISSYLGLQNNLIQDWRHEWGLGDFPFITVQLANFRDGVDEAIHDADSTWAETRESQLLSTRELPNVGMACIIDIGEADDIHPKNKRDVGHRLAQWALSKTYNKPIVANGPHYAGYSIEENKIRIRFTEVGKGLCFHAPEDTLKTCVIAGADKKFIPANAIIDGETLLVWAPELDMPRHVRYAWANNPEGCNLYNIDGLPASPFRTDNPTGL